MSRDDPLRGVEIASSELCEKIARKRRTMVIVLEGSDELRFLNHMRAAASCGGEDYRHILLRPNPRKIEVLEEFLHGTQFDLGLMNVKNAPGLEVHVKRFMIRHRRLLGISADDVRVLQRMLQGAVA
jgi:hypothetical protein